MKKAMKYFSVAVLVGLLGWYVSGDAEMGLVLLIGVLAVEALAALRLATPQ